MNVTAWDPVVPSRSPCQKLCPHAPSGGPSPLPPLGTQPRAEHVEGPEHHASSRSPPHRSSSDRPEGEEEEKSGHPQVIVGHGKVWPEHWGITRQQVRKLLAELCTDPSWDHDGNVYKLVEKVLIPKTRGTGLGYALWLNQECGPQEVNVMVSHAFQENAIDFLSAVVRATEEGEVIYICALCNYQAEDGCGPSIADQLGKEPGESPFHRVMAHIVRKGVRIGRRWKYYNILARLPIIGSCCGLFLFCLPISLASCPDQDWIGEHGTTGLMSCYWFRILSPVSAGCLISSCFLYKWIRCWDRFCAGRLVIVPNYQVDLYERLWCVYEIFVASSLGLRMLKAPSLASAGRRSTRTARCTCEMDQKRIEAAIMLEGKTFERIDSVVWWTMMATEQHILGVAMKYVFLHFVPYSASAILFNATGSESICVFLAAAAFYVAIAVGMYLVVRPLQGRLPINRLILWACIGVLAADSLIETYQERHAPLGSAWHLLALVLPEATAFAVFLLLSICEPFRSHCGPRWKVPVLLVAFSLRVINIEISPLLTRLVIAFLKAWRTLLPFYMVWTESLYFGIRTTGREACPLTVSLTGWLGLCGFIGSRLALLRHLIP